MAFKMKGTAFYGKSPMKGNKKTGPDGKEIHVGGHDAHHGKVWGEKGGPKYKSPMKGDKKTLDDGTESHLGGHDAHHGEKWKEDK